MIVFNTSVPDATPIEPGLVDKGSAELIKAVSTAAKLATLPKREQTAAVAT